MLNADVSYLSITEAGALLRRREISPVELTQLCLDRIAAVDSRLNSFITVTTELALEQARVAEAELSRGLDRGPLHGIPIALKDLYETKGVRTTAHSKVLQDWIPDRDATVTVKLREAGAILLGKLAMHEFAFGAPTFDTPFPPARNPWNIDHVTGGSSTGSGAAVAAGLCYGALGSDTGGSIRNPASQCGVVGLKPTYGRVSRHGVVTLSWSLDHAGPLARGVSDTSILMQVISGHDPSDDASSAAPVPDFSSTLREGIAGMRFAVPRSWFTEGDGADADTVAAVNEAIEVLRGLGAQIEEVDATPFIEARKVNSLILAAEAYSYHEETLATRPQDLSQVLRRRLYEGAFLSAADYIQALRARTVLSRQINDVLEAHTAVLSPVIAAPAERFDAFSAASRYAVPSFTNAFNLTGLPAISVPCGFSTTGMPIGLQIAGRAFDEATVLRIAYAYEQATSWHTMRPPVDGADG